MAPARLEPKIRLTGYRGGDYRGSGFQSTPQPLQGVRSAPIQTLRGRVIVLSGEFQARHPERHGLDPRYYIPASKLTMTLPSIISSPCCVPTAMRVDLPLNAGTLFISWL